MDSFRCYQRVQISLASTEKRPSAAKKARINVFGVLFPLFKIEVVEFLHLMRGPRFKVRNYIEGAVAFNPGGKSVLTQFGLFMVSLFHG